MTPGPDHGADAAAALPAANHIHHLSIAYLTTTDRPGAAAVSAKPSSPVPGQGHAPRGIAANGTGISIQRNRLQPPHFKEQGGLGAYGALRGGHVILTRPLKGQRLHCPEGDADRQACRDEEATAALARKLAVIMDRVLADGTPFSSAVLGTVKDEPPGGGGPKRGHPSGACAPALRSVAGRTEDGSRGLTKERCKIDGPSGGQDM
jgi:hypothetical protein